MPSLRKNFHIWLLFLLFLPQFCICNRIAYQKMWNWQKSHKSAKFKINRAINGIFKSIYQNNAVFSNASLYKWPLMKYIYQLYSWMLSSHHKSSLRKNYSNSKFLRSFLKKKKDWDLERRRKNNNNNNNNRQVGPEILTWVGFLLEYSLAKSRFVLSSPSPLVIFSSPHSNIELWL